jgi:hypothetical protein
MKQYQFTFNASALPAVMAAAPATSTTAEQAVKSLLALLTNNYHDPKTILFSLSCSTPARKRIINKILSLAPTATRPQAIAALRAAGCLP